MAARLQQSGDLVAKLRDVSLAYLSDGSETERLQSIGLLLGPDVQELLQRCEEHVALAASNHFRLLPQCFGHPRQALLALVESLSLGSTSQNHSVVNAVAFVLANQNVRAVNVSVAGNDQREPLDLGFVSDAWWPLVTGLKTRSTASQIDRRLFELCVVTQVANDLKSGDLYISRGGQVPGLPPPTVVVGGGGARVGQLWRAGRYRNRTEAVYSATSQTVGGARTGRRQKLSGQSLSPIRKRRTDTDAG